MTATSRPPAGSGAAEDPTPTRSRSGRAATITGVLIGLTLAALAVTALAVVASPARTPSDADDAGEDHEHVEVDPNPDVPLVDPCESTPEMCGEGAGEVTDGCDEPGMCGDVTPDPDAEEIDARGGDCGGELCGEIGRGEDDGTGP